jgi:hypothetical protein
VPRVQVQVRVQVLGTRNQIAIPKPEPEPEREPQAQNGASAIPLPTNVVRRQPLEAKDGADVGAFPQRAEVFVVAASHLDAVAIHRGGTVQEHDCRVVVTLDRGGGGRVVEGLDIGGIAGDGAREFPSGGVGFPGGAIVHSVKVVELRLRAGEEDMA